MALFLNRILFNQRICVKCYVSSKILKDHTMKFLTQLAWKFLSEKCNSPETFSVKICFICYQLWKKTCKFEIRLFQKERKDFTEMLCKITWNSVKKFLDTNGIHVNCAIKFELWFMFFFLLTYFVNMNLVREKFAVKMLLHR